MEFIKVGKNYMIKNSNGRIVSEKEKLELENKELIIEDIKSNKCQGKTTQKISRNKKKIKDIMEEEKNNKIEEIDTYDEEDLKKTALNKEVQDEIIKEAEKENVKINVDLQPIDSKRVVKYIKEQTALQDKENADETIKETDTTI